MDYRLALMTGIDIPIESCQLIAHQPSITEIAFIGDKDYFVGVQCLCLYKNMFIEDKNVLSDINNFQIFMMIMQEEEAKDKKEATKKVLTILFPNKQVLFTPQSLLFRDMDTNETIMVDESNFEQLQEVLRQIFCINLAPMDQQAFNPAGEKAREIAQKLMRGRERVAAEKHDSDSNIFSQYLSVLSIGLHMPLTSLTELTVFQLYDLIERFYLWMNWDLDVRSRLAGGKPDEKADNWMKNIHTN